MARVSRAEPPVELELPGPPSRVVTVTHPSKCWFPEAGLTKIEVVRYYLAVADGALRGVKDRPMQLERFPQGAGSPPFYQKRAPENLPEWLETVTLRFPSMRTADEIVVRDVAGLIWVVNLGCLSLHPHAIRVDALREGALDHPDELRIDLDPVPGIEWAQVREVALVAREVLSEVGLVAWPKTSGSRGMHLLVRLHPRWGFQEVRKAALGLAREVERRMPGRATARWWKEERQGVFLDYNQNAKDRTVASAYSVRALPDARVSTPLSWEEVPSCEPAQFTVRTVPERFAQRGDPHAEIDGHPGDLTRLLELAEELEERETRLGSGRARPVRETSRTGSPGARSQRASGPTRPQGRVPSKPVLVVAESEDEAAARAGLERWKARYPAVAPLLEPHHVLVDKMRGKYRTWTRIRVNLEAVPEALRPPQETPDPNDAPELPR